MPARTVKYPGRRRSRRLCCPVDDLEQSGPGAFGRENGAYLLHRSPLTLLVSFGVHANRGAAQPGDRREHGKHGREREAKIRGVGLGLGVAGDEPLGRLRSGVPPLIESHPAPPDCSLSAAGCPAATAWSGPPAPRRTPPVRRCAS